MGSVIVHVKIGFILILKIYVGIDTRKWVGNSKLLAEIEQGKEILSLIYEIYQ